MKRPRKDMTHKKEPAPEDIEPTVEVSVGGIVRETGVGASGGFREVGYRSGASEGIDDDELSDTGKETEEK